MSYLPCENPSCKSYGRPHPNCRCHGDLAEGGEASFCARDQKHKNGCEYFADGGEVSDFDSMKEDDAPAVAPSFDDLKADESGAPPFDDLQDDSQGSDENASLSPADLQEKMRVAANPDDVDYNQESKPGGLSLPTSLDDASQRMFTPEGRGLLRTPEDHPLTMEEAREGEEKAAGTGLIAMGGAGPLGMATKFTERAGLGIKGAAALKDAVGFGLVEGANQAQKALMGQGPPQDAVNPYLAVLVQSMIGAGTGFMGGVGAQATAKAVEGPMMKAAANAEHWLAGAGMKAAGEALPKGASEAMKAGHEFIGDAAGRMAEGIGRKTGKALMTKSGAGLVKMVPGVGKKIAHGIEEGAAQIIGRKILKPIIGKPLDKLNQYAGPAIIRWLQNGAQGSVFNMIDYAAKVQKGESLINNSIGALFRTGEHEAFEEAKDSDIEWLRNHVDEGGIEKSLQEENTEQHEAPMYAEGGDVEHKPRTSKIHDHDHIAQNMPEQNVLIQSAKGRILNYLSGQRPQKHVAKLAFDDEPDNREQKKSYEKALQVAVHPMGIMKHVKAGTIDPDHVKHLTSMYPELTGHLQQKLTERIIQEQMDEKKPTFTVRQGLSMLLGTPLSGEFTPQAIQAAQASFAQAKQKHQPQPESSSSQTKGSKTALSKSEQAFLTDDQAREKRQQKA